MRKIIILTVILVTHQSFSQIKPAVISNFHTPAVTSSTEYQKQRLIDKYKEEGLKFYNEGNFKGACEKWDVVISLIGTNNAFASEEARLKYMEFKRRDQGFKYLELGLECLRTNNYQTAFGYLQYSAKLNPLYARTKIWLYYSAVHLSKITLLKKQQLPGDTNIAMITIPEFQLAPEWRWRIFLLNNNNKKIKTISGRDIIPSHVSWSIKAKSKSENDKVAVKCLLQMYNTYDNDTITSETNSLDIK